MYWIRITKSAGTSLDSALDKNIKRITALKENYNKIDEDSFTIIRNPYDKFNSAYKFLTNGKEDGSLRTKNLLNNVKSFSDFINYVINLRDEFEKIKNICVVTADQRTNKQNMMYSKFWIVSHCETSYDCVNFFNALDTTKYFLLEDKNLSEKMNSFGLVTANKLVNFNKSSNSYKLSDSDRLLLENKYPYEFEFYYKLKEKIL